MFVCAFFSFLLLLSINYPVSFIILSFLRHPFSPIARRRCHELFSISIAKESSNCMLISSPVLFVLHFCICSLRCFSVLLLPSVVVPVLPSFLLQRLVLSRAFLNFDRERGFLRALFLSFSLLFPSVLPCLFLPFAPSLCFFLLSWLWYLFDYSFSLSQDGVVSCFPQLRSRKRIPTCCIRFGRSLSRKW